jgi:DNA-binding NarL/FixJ family response regulator
VVTTVLLVGGDLMAKSRLVDATSRAGVTLVSTTVESFRDRLQETEPSVVVVDLDGGREAALDEIRAARDDLLPARVVGYYSHVDRALGEAAEQAGCEPWPRGKFWANLEQLLPPVH